MIFLISWDRKYNSLAVAAGIRVADGEHAWKDSREVDQKEEKEQVKDFLAAEPVPCFVHAPS